MKKLLILASVIFSCLCIAGEANASVTWTIGGINDGYSGNSPGYTLPYYFSITGTGASSNYISFGVKPSQQSASLVTNYGYGQVYGPQTPGTYSFVYNGLFAGLYGTDARRFVTTEPIGDLGVDYGKVRIGDDYFCLYNDGYLDMTARAYNYTCADTFEGATLVVISNTINPIPPPTPQPEPIEEFINGLTCTTRSIPDASSASWFNYGGLANAYNASDASVPDISWVWFGSTSADRDLAIFRPAGTGSVMGTGALTYPGTSTGIIYDAGDLSSYLYIDSMRGGVKTPYNIFQFYGVQNIAFGKAGTFEGLTTDNVVITPTVFTASGGVTTGTIADTNAYFDTLIVRYMTTFKGFRIGQAPLVQKKACSINFNICEWSYEGANLACVSGQNAAGVDFNGCGVTGSGSVYGSGACVPLTNASGSIIPPPAVTGGYVTTDSSGNVVGAVGPPTNSANMWEGVFSCGINTDADDWWETIGKALICPITVAKNFVVRLWNGTSDVQSSLNQINQVSQSALSGTTSMSGSSSYTGSNTLVIAMLDLQEETVENKWWKMQSTYFYMFFLMIIIGMILSVIYLNKN